MSSSYDDSYLSSPEPERLQLSSSTTLKKRKIVFSDDEDYEDIKKVEIIEKEEEKVKIFKNQKKKGDQDIIDLLSMNNKEEWITTTTSIVSTSSSSQNSNKITDEINISSSSKKIKKRNDEVEEIDDVSNEVFEFITGEKKKKRERKSEIVEMIDLNSEEDEAEDEESEEEQQIKKKKKDKKKKKIVYSDDEAFSDDSASSNSFSSDEDEVKSKRTRRRGDDEGDDDDEENDWDEEDSEAMIKRKLKEVIHRCRKVSLRLQESLRLWGADGEDEEKKVGKKTGDCVNLLHLSSSSTSSTSSLLSHSDLHPMLLPSFQLKDYQLVGVNWLRLLHSQNVNGVLADDMGLGKTVQTISFLGWLHMNKHRKGQLNEKEKKNIEQELKKIEEEGALEMQDKEAENEEEVIELDDEDEEFEEEDRRQEETIKNSSSSSFSSILSRIRGEANDDHLPSLIVVPASTLSNWANEFKRFCPALSVVTYHGSQREREDLRYEMKRLLKKKKIDVILCTYVLFERVSNKIDRAFLLKLSYQYMILDEGHCIKNSSSSRYQTLNQFDSAHRILLSGTPVQNNIGELWVLLSFLMPKLFDPNHQHFLVNLIASKEEEERMKKKVLKQGVEEITKKSSNDLFADPLRVIKSILAPFVLRRMKINVLDQLTKKTTEEVFLNMTRRQKNIYTFIIDSYQEKKLALLGGSKGGDEKKKDIYRDISYSNFSLTEDNYQDIISKRDGSEDYVVEDIEIENKNIEKVEPIYISPSPESSLAPKNITEAKHLFTSLRKAANHPLLLRVHYNNEKILKKIIEVAYSNGFFGFFVDTTKVMKDVLENFNDLDIHKICCLYPEALGEYKLKDEILYVSSKMLWLKKNLPELIVILNIIF